MEDYKTIKLKELNDKQKEVVKHINNIIIEQQQIFGQHPEEILISSKDFNIMSDNNKNIKYLLLSTIKIYPI